MDKTNIESLISIFKELTTELPQEMIYRVTGDSIELKTLESVGGAMVADSQLRDWNLVSSQMYGAA